jgi:hypothetical protein
MGGCRTLLTKWQDAFDYVAQTLLSVQSSGDHRKSMTIYWLTIIAEMPSDSRVWRAFTA